MTGDIVTMHAFRKSALPDGRCARCGQPFYHPDHVATTEWVRRAAEGKLPVKVAQR